MRVIHFTAGAGDALWGRGTAGVTLIPLLEAEDAAHVGCLHLSSGAVIDESILDSACALLIVQGRATLIEPCCIPLSAGVGIMLKPRERFRMESEQGAVIMRIEGANLVPTEIAISTPERIAGQRWPGED